MNQNDQGTNGLSWSKWLESAASLWLSAAQSCQELFTSIAGVSRTEEYMQASLAIWRAFLPPWTGIQWSEAKEPSQTPFDTPVAKAEPVSEPQPAQSAQPAAAPDLKYLPRQDTKPELIEAAQKVKPVSEAKPKQKPVTGKAAAKASPKKK